MHAPLPSEIRALEKGLNAPTGTPEKQECDRVLKLYYYSRQTLNGSDPLERDALMIAQGLAAAVGTDEHKACDKLLLENGYIRAGAPPDGRAGSSSAKRKTRGKRNPSRDKTSHHISFLRLFLCIEPARTETEVLARVRLILKRFRGACTTGVFLTPDDIRGILNAVPMIPETQGKAKKQGTKATLEHCRKIYNDVTRTDLSPKQYQDLLRSLPILGTSILSDKVQSFTKEASIVRCLQQAKVFQDITSLLMNSDAEWQELVAEAPKPDAQLDYMKMLVSSSAAISRPAIISAANRELLRISALLRDAWHLANDWALSLAFVFGCMDAKMMEQSLPATAGADFEEILLAAISRQSQWVHDAQAARKRLVSAR
jgi:hypothetical protein